jgi:hypothetical protein
MSKFSSLSFLYFSGCSSDQVFSPCSGWAVPQIFQVVSFLKAAFREVVSLVMLQMKMDKSFKTVNLLWILLKGICCGEGTKTV